MPSPLLTVPAFALVLATGALAQNATWQIPDGGAVRYDEVETYTCKGRNPPFERATRPYATLPYATILLASELTADRRATNVRFVEPRWLVARLAFDLTTFGGARAIDCKVDDLVAFDGVRVVGKALAADADGRQRMELEIRSSPAPLGGPDDKDGARRLMFDSSCHGTLTISRRFDATAGVVAEFAAELVLSIDRSARFPTRQVEYRVSQKWTLRDVVTRRQAGFETSVAESIRRAAAYVRHELAIPNGRLLAPSATDPGSEGFLALGLLALLHAGLPADDAVVRQGFEELRRRAVRQTYSLSLALMATERLYAPANERDLLLGGQLRAPAPRAVGNENATAIKMWARLLLESRDPSVRADYVTRWSYEGIGFDNSNTQYGVLGLHSAQLCGAEIGRNAWFAVAAHWLAEQCPAEGPVVGIELASLRAAKEPGGAAQVTVVQRRGAPRGWSYHGATEVPYGGMTAAGISSLTIALSHLQDGNSTVDVDTRNRCEQAIRDGFVWLTKWRGPRHVPGPTVGHSIHWWCYWLYGLERACELSNVGLIDGHDWYHDHALLLLESQRDDGRWETFGDTCWAILFLKKAQLPVFTEPR